MRLALGLLACAFCAHAQQSPSVPQLPPPEFRKPEAPFVLPPLAPDTERPGLPTKLRVFVRRILVEGSTVFTEPQIKEIVAPFENRELATEDLDELRHRLSLAYASAGYINSGAVLPDQDVKDGEVKLQVVEGRLTEIRVEGENRFRSRFIAGRVEPGEPLNVRTLQESIQLLLQNPQVERVNAELAPGTQRGEALLRMDVKEAKRYTVGFSFANNRSPAVGANRYELSAAARNLTGWGDSLSVRFGHTHGLDDQGFTLSIPVTTKDTLLTLRNERVKSRVIEPPFNIVDVKSNSETTELSLGHPVYRTLRSTLTLGAGLYWRDNATSLLGVPFSFTPGLADGKAKVTAARLFADFLDRTQDSVFAGRLTVSSGLKRGGATRSTGNTPDSQYAAALMQLQWARRLAADGRQLVLRYDQQLASGELLPSEKFALGGAETVRGYRENQIVRDKGWIASAEYRHPVMRLPVAGLSEGDQDGQVSLAAFADFGRAWDHFGADGRRFIWSVGPGVRWDIAEGISAQLYWGLRQKDVVVPNNNPQDKGLHFRVGVARAF